jgi:hypothetical protein
MSPSRFADEIGVQRSAMSHLVSGRNNPSLEFITKVLKRFPEISTEWIISGTGNMTRTTETAPKAVELPLDQGLQFPDELPLPLDLPVKEEPPVAYERQEIPKPPKTRKVPGEKGIERIIIVYNDRSFRELFPEKD